VNRIALFRTLLQQLMTARHQVDQVDMSEPKALGIEVDWWLFQPADRHVRSVAPSHAAGYTLDSQGGASVVTKIQKWGNSQGLRLARHVLEEARLAVGDDVDVTARDGLIVIAPARPIRGKRDLTELVARIPEGYKAEELDWGDPQGREVW
jgi:antitoxin MazE